MPLQSERGLLGFSNCLATVPQDKLYAAERFGMFNKILRPGLQWAGFDLCGVCVTLASVSSRVEQHLLSVPTKTKDNVFVQAVIAAQLSVDPGHAEDALYKLGDVGAQLDAYVSDTVRSQLPTMNLDEAFENKDQLSRTVQERLTGQMAAFGWIIHKALVIEIRVNGEVMQSMNEISKQKRLRDASVMAAEAEKIRTVKAAEAQADATCLQGEGIARQRAAIIQGLRTSLSNGGERPISTDEISALLLTTQYFETLKQIGSHPTSKTYYLPKEDPNDVDAQIRSGMLQGTAALEYLVGGAGPVQQSMGPSAPALGSATAAGPPPTSRPPAWEPPPQARPPSPAQPPEPQPSGQQGPVRLQIQVPANVMPGQILQVRAPDGRLLQVKVPANAPPGSTIQIQI